MTLKRIMEELPTMFLIVIVCIIGVKVGNYNGRIEMCTDLDRFYTNDGCQSCEEVGRLWINNTCVVPMITSTPDYMQLGGG